jgi:carboxypeptidase Taq
MRTRRSAEQMLAELKHRLREISDLNATGDVLSWDQATYMPAGGADARGRQRDALPAGARAGSCAGARQAD